MEVTNIEWRIPCRDIPLITNHGIVYFNGDVSEKNKMQHVETLVKQEAIHAMEPHEKGFFSRVLFLKKKWRKTLKTENFWTSRN